MVGCSMSSVFSADADWNVINTAIDDPIGSNPEVVKNSILNILRDLQIPQPSVRRTVVAAPPVVVAPPIVTAPPVVVAPLVQQPSPVFVPQSPSRPQQVPYFQILQDIQSSLNQQLLQNSPPKPQQTISYGENVVQLMPQYRPAPIQKTKPCGKESVAEFMVNVPCPTPTPKPVREIVVKVPCPTTTEKPCQCQCCPCSPCPKKQKKPRKAEVIYVSSEEKEPCKHPKSYKKPMKQHKKESKVIYEESSEEEEDVEVSSEESEEVEINSKPVHKEHKSIYTHFTPNVRSYNQPKKQQNVQPTIVYHPSGGYQRVQMKEKKDFDN